MTSQIYLKEKANSFSGKRSIKCNLKLITVPNGETAKHFQTPTYLTTKNKNWKFPF